MRLHFIISIFFLLVFITNVKTQITSPSSTANQMTAYTNGATNDPVFIFCSPDASGLPITGSLTATPASGTPNWTFNWFTYTLATNSWTPLSTQTNVPSSTISGLAGGGYRVVITDAGGNIIGCFRAWVWVINTTLNVANIPPGCTPFSLNGTLSVANNSFNYYNPPADPFIIGPSTTITVCLTANHTYVSDIGFFLVGPPSCGSPTLPLAPNPQTINSANGCCCNSGNNVSNLCFSTANTNMLAVCGSGVPLTGNYGIYGQGPPYTANQNNWAPIYGCDATQGGWSVQIYDCIGADIGSLTNVNITFSGNSSCGPSTITYNSGAINSAINDNSCAPTTASIYTVPNPPPTVAQTITTTTTYQWSANPTYTIPNSTTNLTPSINPAPTQNTWFYLTATNSFGCTTIDSALFNYTPPSAPTITPVGPFCDYDPPLNLTTSVSGGTWSGVGITDSINGLFNPSVAGSGTHIISYTTPPPCGNTATTTIIVGASPTATFTFTNECFGSSTGFTDLSTANGGTIALWDWDFNNDGVVDNSSLVSNNPTNGYPSAGTYTAELLVTTALGCVDSTTMQIVVDPIPVASFTATNECVGTATTIVNTSTVATGSITGWGWDYGDMAGTSALQNPPPYTYTNSGNYTVTLVVSSDSGCTNTTTVNIDIYAVPNAAFITNNECLNVAATFTDNSNGNGGVINSWDWDLDGNGTTDDTNQNLSNLYSLDGTYNVQLIVATAFGCADTVVQPITIYPMPTANFTFINKCLGVGVPYTDNSTVTSGTIANWTWNFGNSNTSITQNPTENFALEGVYTTQLIVTTNNGCEDTLTQQIEVWPNPVVNFNPTEVCLNALTQFTDLSTISNAYTTNTITLWNWNFNGQGSSIIQSPTFTFNTEGIIPTTLSITTNNGCTHDTTINVTVNPLPQVSFGADKLNGCSPVCATFNNTSIISSGTMSYLWDFGDGSGSNIQNPSYCFNNSSRVTTKTFDITLTVTSDKNCTISVMQPNMVTAYPIPLADFIIDPEITDVYNKEITFTDASQISTIWNWDFGDSATSTIANPVHLYADSGSYTVTLYIENQYGCRDTFIRELRIRPSYAVWIPNVFTPDGDGMNDYFFVDGFGIKEIQTLVFDRWGGLVYEGYLLDSKWDGLYKGSLLQEGVYVYKVKVRNIFNEWHEFVGRITMVR